MFPHPIFMLVISTVIMLIGVMIITNGECLAGWASINCLALLYNATDATVFTLAAGTLPPIQISFTSIGPNSHLLERCVLEKFPRSQHQYLLITPPRFALSVPSMPVKQWNFNKIKWCHYIALINWQRLCCYLIHLMWTQLK